MRLHKMISLVAIIAVSLLSNGCGNKSNDQYLNNTMNLAKQGKTVDSEGIKVGDLISDVEKKWGKRTWAGPNKPGASQMDWVDKPLFQKGSVGIFGWPDKNDVLKVIWIEQTAKAGITLEEVKKSFGKPFKEYEDNVGILYKAGDSYEINFLAEGGKVTSFVVGLPFNTQDSGSK